jgi:hypothetical protein
LNITTNTNTDHDEAQEILDALRKIQDSPELRAEAKTNPEAAVSRLGLSDVAGHAVAFAIAAAIVVSPLKTAGFWN